MAFHTSVEVRPGGREVVKLLDDMTGASASILPSFGFNLFDLHLPVVGKPTPIIVSAADFADDPKHPGRNGTAILFPYPNRVAGGKYSFGGKDYTLPINAGPNSIHGFALEAPWDVIDRGMDGTGAFVVGRYHLASHSAEHRDQWPTDAILQVRYSLAGRKLTMTVTVSNPSDRDLPYGFGIHPYFRLPFPPGGDPNRTRIVVPAGKFWVLDQFIPTGEVRDVVPRLDFRDGQPRTGLKLDDVVTGLNFRGDFASCRLIDLEKDTEFRIGFDRTFREVVLYTPPGTTDVLAVEPYTQTTDAIHLEARGVDAGLRVLKHGASETMVITMETADAPN
jgi:aldose 1-epimerase